jgi:hypothetical protein
MTASTTKGSGGGLCDDPVALATLRPPTLLLGTALAGGFPTVRGEDRPFHTPYRPRGMDRGQCKGRRRQENLLILR